LEKIPFFVVGLADGVITLAFGIRTHLLEPVTGLGWAPRIAITVYSMAFYLLKTILPIGLSPLYPLTRYKTHLSGMPFGLSAAAVLLVTFTCIALRRKLPGMLLAWIACAVTLLPVSGILQAGFQIAADRYTYLACLSWALLAGAGVTLARRAMDQSRIGKALLASAAVLVFLTLSLLTTKQLAVWRDSRTLWTRAIAVEPFFATHLNLASALFNEGDTLGAIDQYRRAIALWPDNAAIHCMLGGALLDLRKAAEAASEFRLAVHFGPSSDAYIGLTHALVMQGKLDEGIEVIQEALRRDPGNVRYTSSLEQATRLKTEPHEQR
jgi:Tfp pilus assembly protein PilF